MMNRRIRTMQTYVREGAEEEEMKGFPHKMTFGDHAADAAVTAIGTAVGVGSVTLIQHLVSDGASALFGGVSAGSAFSA